MANIIKIKRGSGVPATSVLAGYELGWDYLNNSLYIGVQGSNPIKIVDAFSDFISINKATGTLTASSLFVFNGGVNINTLSVSGATTLGDADDDINILRGTVTISDIGRTTTIKGLLEVDGTSGFDGSIRIGTSGTSKTTIDSATGNLYTLGMLTVDGASYLNGLLDVDGATTLRNSLAVLGNSELTGTLIIHNDLTAYANTSLGTNSTDLLTVNATSTFNAGVTVTGISSLDGGIDVNAKMTVAAATGNITTVGDLTVANAVVNGNLTVHGTTTTVNSTTVTVSDPIFTLGETLIVSDAKDRGIEFNYGDTGAPLTGFFGLDESTGRFVFIPDATNTSEVFSGVWGDYQVGEIYQPQTLGVYNSAGAVVNASALWNAASNTVAGMQTGVQYDLLQADSNGLFQPTKTIPAESGITIDCGEY